MKKLLLILFTFLIILGVKPIQNTKAAVVNDIVFSCNTIYTPPAIQGALYFGKGATDIYFSVPENLTALNDNGAYIWTVSFYDEYGTQVNFIQLTDIFGSFVSINNGFYFDLAALNINESAVSLKIIIPLGVSDVCDSTTTDYYNIDVITTIGYTGVSYGQFSFTYLENTVSSYPTDIFPYDYLLSNVVDIPADTRVINIESTSLPSKITFQLMTYHSTIEFFNVLGGSEGTYNLDTFKIDGVYRYDDIDLVIDELSNYDDFASFQLKLVQTKVYPSWIHFMNNSLQYTFDNKSLPLVNFYVDGVIIDSTFGPFGKYVDAEGGYPEKLGYDFIEWVYHDNSAYTYYEGLNEDYFINNEINIYAVFRLIPVDAVGVVVDTTPDEESPFTYAMTSLGFNDPIERTIIFGFVVVLTALLLLFKNVSNLAILIVVSCELMFFMYLGVIPLFAAILVGLILLLLGLKTLSSGGGLDE